MAISKNSHPDIQYVPTTTKLRTVSGAPPVGDNKGNSFSPIGVSTPHFIYFNGQMPMYPTEGLINLFSPSPGNFPAQQFVDIKWYYPKSLTQYPPYNTLELEGIVFQSAAADAQFFGKFTFVWDYFGGIATSHFTRPDVETYAGITSYFDIATSYGEFLHSDGSGGNSDFSYYRVYLQSNTNGFLQINFKYTFI